MLLLEEGAFSRDGFNGPYASSSRQKGFVNFGVSHVLRILGSAELAMKSAWYQKWNVHLFPRPEVRFLRPPYAGAATRKGFDVEPRPTISSPVDVEGSGS